MRLYTLKSGITMVPCFRTSTPLIPYWATTSSIE